MTEPSYDIRQHTLNEVDEWLQAMTYYRGQSRFTPGSILQKFRHNFMPAEDSE